MRLRRMQTNLNVPISLGLKERLEKRATKCGLTMAEFARDALQTALEREEAMS